MNHHRSLVVLAAATLLACRAGGAPQAQAAEKPAATAVPAESKPSAPPAAIPKIADPRTEALVGWLESFFPWGAGEVTADALDSVRIPGWRLYRAAKKFAADERANDQAFVLADDAGKTALVGDVFVDEARLKAPKAIRGEADLDTLRELLGKFLRGRFKVSFDPSLDRRSFKGLKIQHETGYGAYEISAYVASDDGALLLVGRAWDRGRGFAEQRKAMIKLDGAPSAGPADATVTIVEYSDMQCPFCKKRAGDLETLIHKLGKELKIRKVAKNFPISEHTWAFRAASAGRCFYEKDKDFFYNWKASVLARQETLSVGELDTFALDFAVSNGISEEAFRSCYLQGSSVKRVLDDLGEGFAVRVRSTPTYFIDGVPLSWFSDNLMEEYLRKTYLKGAGLPLPAPAAPATPSAARPAPAKK
ncbi:MAG: DsbA family protein [Holophagales bacterium]|nr:DsbA family protein [Holophagales bacterium]MBK9963974.1 DsbA family protein [Holophagales bacterium]